MSDLLSNFQKASSQTALELIASSPATLQQLQATYQQLFPNQPLSAVSKAYADLVMQNDSLDATVASTLDAADGVLHALGVIEQYITLTVPKMEDGGNFGVGVQLAAVKVITDARESVQKKVDDLFSYTSTRADALEKCKLDGSTCTTKTATSSTSESTGNDSEKGDTKSNSNSQNTEEKSVTTVNAEAPALTALRKAAVVAVDVKYYAQAKATFQAALTSYMAIVDFCDKNQTKIEKPKGENSGGYSGSMY